MSDSAHKGTSNPMSRDEMLAKDKKYIVRPWNGRNEPVPIVSAKDCVVTEAGGKEYLDFTSGYFVNNVGHTHPKVVAAATKQMQSVSQVSGRHTSYPVINLAEKLVQISPKSVNKVFFTTSGSESNEFALKMARQYKNKPDIAALDNGFHGLSLGALAACGSEKYRDTAGVPLSSNVYRVPTPYCYRCPHVNDCETQCLDEVEQTIEKHPNTAAMLAEPVQSVGGIIPSDRWWKRADEIRQKYNLLLILDEIQTGMGRTGKLFAAEHYGLEPDIMTSAKGLSGGVGSLGVVLVNDKIAEGFFGGTTPTSGGNAISAAAGLALIETLYEENIIDHCAQAGRYFHDALVDLNDPWIGDVRFLGLLGGVEMVSSKETKEPLAKAILGSIHDALHEQGMLVTLSGPLGNFFRLQPPLTIKTNQIDHFVTTFNTVLQRVRTTV